MQWPSWSQFVGTQLGLLFQLSHPRTEETLLDEGGPASGPWWCFGFLVLVSCLVGFCLVWGRLCLFPLIM